ncbi:hypothetical protein OENI_50139 [Oenococcus oeni]|nr:hypothetical protein OENI_50139 [Oenococcus oeni]SYW19180.1 hypothetical protein OENI_70140 [Oenococcus oeni]
MLSCSYSVNFPAINSALILFVKIITPSTISLNIQHSKHLYDYDLTIYSGALTIYFVRRPD